MIRPLRVALVVTAVGLGLGVAILGVRGQPAGTARKKVLVELFTSQGCNSCPSAEQLLGQLAALGYGPDRIVPLAFHVDYFNDPWKDRFSDRRFSARQWAYNGALKRTDLYFTPMLMIDGRFPMLGSDRKKAREALELALAERPTASIALALEAVPGKPREKTLKVTVAARGSDVDGRELLVGVATFEDPVTTRVESGENAGKALVEHFAVRRFAVEPVTPARSGPRTLSVPVALEADWDARRCGLAVFLQDETTGRVYEAESIRWAARAAPRGIGAGPRTSKPVTAVVAPESRLVYDPGVR
jgi:hypothetical protein